MAVTSGPADRADQFAVVVNDEEQYSIWPLGRTLPAGWRDTGESGDRARCLEHIEAVWTDMRPRSVRTATAGGPSHGA